MNYSKDETLTMVGIKLKNYLPNIGITKVRAEILEGLRSSPKYISSKFFYDEKGSELFEGITELDEYYPTRTEKKILSGFVQKLDVDFTYLNIIDLGSGDHSKIRLLLGQIPPGKLDTLTYIPVDISQSAIEGSAQKLSAEFPGIKINGIISDFFYHLNRIPKTGKRLFCFFGSTIGNLTMKEIKKFMTLLGNELKQGDSFLLGLDMIKDTSVLNKAYNDEKQITAEFNKNILNVVNNLADTNFNTTDFNHLAFYDKEKKRIEMHLKANKDIVVTINSETEKIFIKKGETIHTENSQKFNENDIQTIGSWAGLEKVTTFTDNQKWFSLVHYRKNI